MILIPAIIVGGHLVAAVADRPPVVNFEETCRSEMQMNDKIEICIADEKQARDQLAGKWASFDPTARTRCARMSAGGHASSYIELLVCLELDQADKEVHGRGGTAGILLTAPERPVSQVDEAPDQSQNRPGPIETPSRPASVAAPSRPAPIPRSLQQPVAAVAPPAAPPAAAPLPMSPSPPVSAPQPTSQAEVLRQSLCRSPLGYILPGCR